MHKIIVTGIGTDIGKTIVSAILTQVLEADYWKPIQCGEEEGTDSSRIKAWLEGVRIHPPAYSLKASLSPHHAARLEDVTIDPEAITCPKIKHFLVIETAGGLFVPLTNKTVVFDVLKDWECQWVVVSKNYLGSINHTLLTVDALKRRGVRVLGLIFNGEPNPDSEAAILQITQLPFLGRFLPEKQIDTNVIRRYAQQWKPQILQQLH